MHDLLERVLAAHGGPDRWNAFNEVSTTVVTGGDFWATKGITTDNIRSRDAAGMGNPCAVWQSGLANDIPSHPGCD